MSLPLTRRILRTALLVAAGAAPVVGAAGTASAAGLPVNTHAAGIEVPDAIGHGTVGQTSGKAVQTVNQVGGNTLHRTVPDAGAALRNAPGGSTVGQTAGGALNTVDGTAEGTAQGLPTAGLPGMPA